MILTHIHYYYYYDYYYYYLFPHAHIADIEKVVNTYKSMRAQISNLASKISELEGDRRCFLPCNIDIFCPIKIFSLYSSEHQLVIRTISGLDPGRRCFRSIGGNIRFCFYAFIFSNLFTCFWILKELVHFSSDFLILQLKWFVLLFIIFNFTFFIRCFSRANDSRSSPCRTEKYARGLLHKLKAIFN